MLGSTRPGAMVQAPGDRLVAMYDHRDVDVPVLVADDAGRVPPVMVRYWPDTAIRDRALDWDAPAPLCCTTRYLVAVL